MSVVGQKRPRSDEEKPEKGIFAIAFDIETAGRHLHGRGPNETSVLAPFAIGCYIVKLNAENEWAHHRTIRIVNQEMFDKFQAANGPEINESFAWRAALKHVGGDDITFDEFWSDKDKSGGFDTLFAIDRLTQGIHNTAKKLFAHRNLNNFICSFYGRAFFN